MNSWKQRRRLGEDVLKFLFEPRGTAYKKKQTATTKEIGHTKDDSVKGMKLYDQNVISYLDLSLFDAEKWGLESNQERDELLEGKLLMSFPIIFLLQIVLNKSIFSYTKEAWK